MDSNYYLNRLTEEFCKRQRVNRAYSMRAFARFLQLDSSTLVSVLKRKRPLPLKRANAIAERLGLSPEEKQNFYNSVLYSRFGMARLLDPTISQKALSEESHYRIIAEWEHYAVLNLLRHPNAKSDPVWIARRLGISEIRAKDVIQRLIDGGLLKINANGAYERTLNRVTTSEDLISSSLQKSHKESLEMAIKKIDEVPVQLRDYSSETVSIDMSKLEEAKAAIRAFRMKFNSLASKGNANEVYQLCVQFYPLTQLNPSNHPNKE